MTTSLLYRSSRIPFRSLWKTDWPRFRFWLGGICLLTLLIPFIISVFTPHEKLKKAVLTLDIVTWGNVVVEIYGDPRDADLYRGRGILFGVFLAEGFHALDPEKYGGMLEGVPPESFTKCLVESRKVWPHLRFKKECFKYGSLSEEGWFELDDAPKLVKSIKAYSNQRLSIM